MSDWGTTQSAGQVGSSGVVSVLIASPSQTGSAWHQQLLVDSRFRVQGLAVSLDDLQYKMSSAPDVLLLDGPIFQNPRQLAEFLTRVKAAVYVSVPPSIEDNDFNVLQNLECVKGIYKGDISISQIAGKMIQDVEVMRSLAPQAAPIQFTSSGRPTGSGGGTLIITIWSAAGGTGKSTLAAGLAQDAGLRELRTLLVGLRVPDSLPALLNIKRTPNIGSWFSAPGPEGFKRSIQSVGTFDVILGLHDKTREQQLYEKPEHAASITRLVDEALRARYGVIILDASYSGMNAISPANTLILTARPTLDDALSIGEAYRVVAQKLTGPHSIGLGNMMTVLNMQQGGMMTAAEFHASATKVVADHGLTSFPHVAAEIPYDPNIAVAMNAGRLPLDASDNFARPVHRIGDLLFGARQTSNGHKAGKVRSLGFIKFRVK